MAEAMGSLLKLKTVETAHRRESGYGASATALSHAWSLMERRPGGRGLFRVRNRK